MLTPLGSSPSGTRRFGSWRQQFLRPTSARIIVFIEQQEPVCNDSSNTTAPWEHDSDEWRALPGGGLPAHHARELARNGTNQTAQAQHWSDYRSPVPFGRPRRAGGAG